MQIVKQSVARSLPCILIEAADGQTPDTGVAAGSTTINFRKEGAEAWSSKTATGNWTEVGKGVYLIDWSATDLNTVGRFDFVVEVSGDINYYGSLVVSANLLDDLDATLDGLNDLDAAGVLAAVTTDDTKWDGADIDTAISTRSSHAAADVVALMNDLDAAAILAALTTDSVKWQGADIAATLAAVGGLNDLALTDILSDATAFAGADIAAIVSAIAALNDLNAAEILAAITTDSVKFSGALIANLNAAITTRSSHTAADVVALMNDPTVAAIWSEVQSGYTTPGTFGYFLDLQVSAAGGGAAPTVAQIAEAVHDVKVTFDKTTGALVITMADDTPLTSVTITDTAGEVTRE